MYDILAQKLDQNFDNNFKIAFEYRSNFAILQKRIWMYFCSIKETIIIYLTFLEI